MTKETSSPGAPPHELTKVTHLGLRVGIPESDIVNDEGYSQAYELVVNLADTDRQAGSVRINRQDV